MYIRQMVELWDFCVFTNEWVSVEMRCGFVEVAVKWVLRDLQFASSKGA